MSSELSVLALDIAGALEHLNPADLSARATLRQRLEAAGIARDIPDAALTDADRDTLIEYELGKVLSTLSRDIVLAQDSRWLAYSSAGLVYLHDLPDPDPAPTDRHTLAREVVGLLDVGGYDDPARRHALAARLMAAGIRRGMHNHYATRTRTPAQDDSENVLERMENRLVELLSWEITVAEWPTDQRIEYELGQLLILLLIHDQGQWDQRTRLANPGLAARRTALLEAISE